MKETCIQHPANEPLIIIRKSQVEFCSGNSCAAALMSYFEYWHNIKLSMRPKNARLNAMDQEYGNEAVHDESLMQFHSLEELETGILGIYGQSSIKTARKALVSLGVITEHQNPSERYKFDRTIYYLFHPEIYQEWLETRIPSEQLNLTTRQDENTSRSVKNTPPSVKTSSSIHKITIETSTETERKEYVHQQADARCGGGSLRSQEQAEVLTDSHDSLQAQAANQEQERLQANNAIVKSSQTDKPDFVAEEFARLWENMGFRKVGKANAEKAFRALCRGKGEERVRAGVDMILEDTTERLNAVPANQFNPYRNLHLSTYINGKRWEDAQLQATA